MSRIRTFLLASHRRSRRDALATQRGLTLLEIMIVIAILGLLIAIVVPRVMGALSSSKVDLTHAAVVKIATEDYPRWAVANGDKGCPDSLLEVAKFVEKTQDDITDPWGRPYEFYCGSNLPAGAAHFAVYSLGENKEDPSDDIKSWEKVKK